MFYKFFFLERKVDRNFLALFRIAVGVFMLTHFLSFISDFDLLYGKDAIVDQSFMVLFKPAFIPSFSQLSQIIEQSFHVTPLFVSTTFKIIYITACLSLIAGIFSRFSSLLLLFLHLILIKGDLLLSYGVDLFSTIAIFYCIIFPVGRTLAIDKRLFKLKNVNETPYRRILELHLCIVYFMSGFEKVIGSVWRNGEAIWQTMNLLSPTVAISANYTFISKVSFLAVVVGWTIIIIELFYPLFIWKKPYKDVWISLVCLMHLGIAVFMGLYYFAMLMIILSTTAFIDLTYLNNLLSQYYKFSKSLLK